MKAARGGSELHLKPLSLYLVGNSDSTINIIVDKRTIMSGLSGGSGLGVGIRTAYGLDVKADVAKHSNLVGATQ